MTRFLFALGKPALVATLAAFSFTSSMAFAQDAKITKPETKSAKGAKMSAGKNPVVVMETSLGPIEIELDQEKAPISTENFLKYTDDKFFDGTIFHRVIPDFMIQGGGFTTDMKQKETRAQIKNEAKNGLANKRGTIAMARTMVVDSASSQFFINTVDNAMLDHRGEGQAYGYAVFGKVTSGMDTVDKIRAVSTGDKGGHQNVPNTPVVIKSVKRK